jgi:hypothetical protein
MSLSFTYPSRLQVPRQMSVCVDCTDRWFWMWDKTMQPWLKTCSTSVDVAEMGNNVSNREWIQWVTYYIPGFKPKLSKWQPINGKCLLGTGTGLGQVSLAIPIPVPAIKPMQYPHTLVIHYLYPWFLFIIPLIVILILYPLLLTISCVLVIVFGVASTGVAKKLCLYFGF